MSESKTYGTPVYGPFSDGTVQTYFRFSPEHTGSSGQREYDVQLMMPSPARDVMFDKVAHVRVDK